MNRLDRLDIGLTAGQKEKLEAYMDEILAMNEHINLTAITDRDEFIEKHIADSLLWADLPCIRGSRRIIDAGTGAGFPGIPLAVIYPEKRFVLLDSLNKKLEVVAETAEKLGIDNVRTLHMRTEDAGRDDKHRESYDLCVTRALAPLPVLLEYTLPLVKKGGYVVAYKGPNYESELAEARNALGILGGTLRSVETSDALSDMRHVALVIEKTAETPASYPRKAGVPSKKPIR